MGGGRIIKDATAVPEDVAAGKIFYNNNGKQAGVYESTLDTMGFKNAVISTAYYGADYAFGYATKSEQLITSDYSMPMYTSTTSAYNTKHNYNNNLMFGKHFDLNFLQKRCIGIKVNDCYFGIGDKNTLVMVFDIFRGQNGVREDSNYHALCFKICNKERVYELGLYDNRYQAGMSVLAIDINLQFLLID